MILFLGGYFDKSIEDQIKRNSFNEPIQYSSNNFQFLLIKSLSYFSKVKVLSAPFIGTYPFSYKKFYFHSSHFKNPYFNGKHISFINLWGLKLFSKFISLLTNILQMNKITEIFVYSPQSILLLSALIYKLFKNKTKVILLINDHPKYTNINKNINFFYKFLKSIDFLLYKKIVKFVDRFVFVSKYLNDEFNKNNKKYLVLEGICFEKIDLENQEQIKLDKSLVYFFYSGNLSYRFGIIELIKSLKFIDNDKIRLLIAGSGESSEEIIKLSMIDSRIIYLGQISNEQARKYQELSNFLVNPRPPFEDYTKYSFPLKTFEYIASRKPLICFKMPSFPEYLDSYLNYFSDFDINSMAKSLNNILSSNYDELIEKANYCYIFLIKHRSISQVSIYLKDLIE
jgi:hypothetical protein